MEELLFLYFPRTRSTSPALQALIAVFAEGPVPRQGRRTFAVRGNALVGQVLRPLIWRKSFASREVSMGIDR
ncbi:MAG: hypothetical protein DI533_05845 [Cereibacter sphaeroides]|uniref:Uncharacterized protein n=1 Tax=Cereibacter sphaeroides TaxID=1063 RepID=A0A2W5SLA6_CERSP|nr:MAG: hypothetical protein DI533_05845 [Cereibacter sphaeroides]